MPFSAFGAQTDHFGLLALTGQGTTFTLKVKSSKKEPVAKSRADAKNAKGDIAASTFFGSTTIYDIETTYELIGGSMQLVTAGLKLGLLTVGETAPALLSVSVSTDSGKWPEIRCSGKLGQSIEKVDGEFYTWSLPAITLAGRKMAQEIGFTTDSGCRLTGTSADFEISIQEATDGLGAPVAHDLEGGTWKVSATFVAVTATPACTITSPGLGLTLVKAPGIEEPDAAYGTATMEAEGTLTRDAA
jgi:hypothetical protein